MTAQSEPHRASVIENMARTLIDSMVKRRCFKPTWDELDAGLRNRWIEGMVGVVEALSARSVAEYLTDHAGFKPQGEFPIWLVGAKADLLHRHQLFELKKARTAS